MNNKIWPVLVGLIILAIALGTTNTAPEQKEYKKQAGETVSFRTSDTTYSAGNIAFNTACDGTNLEQHNYYGQGSTTTGCTGTKILDNLPGTTLPSSTGPITCSSSIALYSVPYSTVSHRVCCYGTRDGVGAAYFYVNYDRTVSGSQSAISSNPSNEVVCASQPSGSCDITFNEFIAYANAWANCETAPA